MPRSDASLAEVRRYADEQDRIAAATARQLRFAWLDTADRGESIEDSALRFGKTAPSLLFAGQDAAVRSSDIYLARYLSLETGRKVAPLALDPAQFRGLAGTEAPPRLAFFTAATRAASYSLGVGLGADSAIANAGAAIARLTRTEVRVAARAYFAMAIDGREIRGRPRVRGYTRVTTGSSSCLACLSAAGQTFDSGERFAYHPGCSCNVVPIVDGVTERVGVPNGRDLFERMGVDKQNRMFGDRAAQLIRDGAPLSDFAATDGRYFTQATIKEATT